MVTLLSTSVLTATARSATSLLRSTTRAASSRKDLIRQSAIRETADALSELLNTPVPVNRIEYVQEPGEKAVIFKLKSRIPVGVILSREEIERFGYEFGLLTRVS